MLLLSLIVMADLLLVMANLLIVVAGLLIVVAGLLIVMAGLVPAIHVFRAYQTEKYFACGLSTTIALVDCSG